MMRGSYNFDLAAILAVVLLAAAEVAVGSKGDEKALVITMTLVDEYTNTDDSLSALDKLKRSIDGGDGWNELVLFQMIVTCGYTLQDLRRTGLDELQGEMNSVGCWYLVRYKDALLQQLVGARDFKQNIFLLAKHVWSHSDNGMREMKSRLDECDGDDAGAGGVVADTFPDSQVAPRTKNYLRTVFVSDKNARLETCKRIFMQTTGGGGSSSSSNSNPTTSDDWHCEYLQVLHLYLTVYGECVDRMISLLAIISENMMAYNDGVMGVILAAEKRKLRHHIVSHFDGMILGPNNEQSVLDIARLFILMNQQSFPQLRSTSASPLPRDGSEITRDDNGRTVFGRGSARSSYSGGSGEPASRTSLQPSRGASSKSMHSSSSLGGDDGGSTPGGATPDSRIDRLAESFIRNTHEQFTQERMEELQRAEREFQAVLARGVGQPPSPNDRCKPKRLCPCLAWNMGRSSSSGMSKLTQPVCDCFKKVKENLEDRGYF